MTRRLTMFGHAALGAIAATVMTPVASAQTAQPAPVEMAPAQTETGSQITAGVYDIEIVNTYPHDAEAFTQGLVWHDGALYESTGQKGKSEIRRVELATGKVLARSAIPADQFGEGLALVGDEFISLTWQDGIIHRWSADSLDHVASIEGYPGEGWGLATYQGELYASDGSDALRVLDPETLRVKRTIPVRMNGEPINLLNELEAVDGYIFANLWTTPYIVGINPASGSAEIIIDLSNLPRPSSASPEAVLNGIAWDVQGRRMFVTGKLWDKLYEVRLVPKPVDQN